MRSSVRALGALFAAATALAGCTYDDQRFGYQPGYGYPGQAPASGYDPHDQGYGGQGYGEQGYVDPRYPGRVAPPYSGDPRNPGGYRDPRDGLRDGGYYRGERFGQHEYIGREFAGRGYRGGYGVLDPWLASTREGQDIIRFGFDRGGYGELRGQEADRANEWFRRFADVDRDLRLTDQEIRQGLHQAARDRPFSGYD